MRIKALKRKLALGLTLTLMLGLFLTACGSPGAGGSTGPGSSAAVKGGTSSAGEAQQATYTIRIGHGYPADHPVNLAVKKMVEEVETKTQGRVKFEIHPNAELGNESAMSEMIQNGTLQMGVMSTSTISGFEPTVQLFDLPYLFPSTAVAYKVLDGKVGDMVSANMLSHAHMQNLAYYENDYRDFFNNVRPIQTPDDLKGIKMRVPAMPMLTNWLKKIGCLPTTIPGNEVYSSLQQGIVDGLENGPIMTYLGGYYECVKYYSVTDHVYGAAMVLINEDYWKSLPQDIQKILSDAAYSSRVYEREQNASIRQSCIDKMEKTGIKVNYLTDEQVAVFQKSAKDAVYSDIKNVVGTDLYNGAMDAVAEAQANK